MRVIFLFYILVSYAFSIENTLVPFTTDGCSVVPDFKFTDCCVVHDLEYWKGGTWEQRLIADQNLRACIKEKSNAFVASMFYWGVRLGGSPHMLTSYRWGYGWEYLRSYDELSLSEMEQVERLNPQDIFSFPIVLPKKNYSKIPMRHGSYCLDEIYEYINRNYSEEQLEITNIRLSEDAYFKSVRVTLNTKDVLLFTYKLKTWKGCHEPRYLEPSRLYLKVSKSKGY